MARKHHIMVVPFPIAGHMNPMLEFSRRLAANGLIVTIITTHTISKCLKSLESSIKIESIPDGFNDGEKPEDLVAYVTNFIAATSQNLKGIVLKQNSSGYPVKLLVYDSGLPGALDLAHGLHIQGASFFTQSCAVSVIYYQMHQGSLKTPLEDGSAVSLPSLPQLSINDLPSLISDTNFYSDVLKNLVDQFSNIVDADWVFFNSFDKLENEVVSWIKTQWKITTIGPIIPSIYLDQRLNGKDHGLSLTDSNAEACMKWLNARKSGSVVYVSFGSVARIREEQMEELGKGLVRSNHYFLWIVRASEQSKLPSNFKDMASKKGCVLNWCPQLEVLSHQAVGCFVTHCGWNSTLEALSLGVPMVAMPVWSDQPTNAKFVQDVWKTGVRAKANKEGIFTGEELEKCVKLVMEAENGNQLRSNAVRWRELAIEAVDEGGGSDMNIDAFVAKIVSA